MASLEKDYHVCLICLQTFFPSSVTQQKFVESRDEKEVPEVASRNNFLYARFLPFIGKYFRLRLTSKKFLQFMHDGKRVKDLNLQVLQDPFCAKCYHLVSDICDLYKRLEVMEMILKWKLGEVGVVMETGSKSISKKLRKGLLTRLTKQLNAGNKRDAVERFRDMVRIQCKANWNKSAPKVMVDNGVTMAMRQMLIRLMIVYYLALVAESLMKKKSFHPPPGVVEEVKMEQDPDNNDEDNPEEPFPDGNDSDWSRGAASPVSNVSTAEDEDKDSNKQVKKARKRKWNLRRRPSVKCKEEVKTDEDSNDKDEEDKEWKEPPRPKRKYVFKPGPKRKRGPKPSMHKKAFTKSYICKACNMTFSRKSAQMLHFRSQHPNYFNSFCEVCGLAFSHKAGEFQSNHWTNVHNGIYSCLTCQQSFPENKLLWSHLAFHETPSEKNFACPYCLRGFTTGQMYNLHMKLAHAKTGSRSTYPCVADTCSDVFDSLSELTEHLRGSHLPPGEDKDLFFCETCSQPFLDNERKEIHQLVHLPPSDPIKGEGFQCPKCQVNHTDVRDLIGHYNRLHGLSIIKPLKCKLCGNELLTVGCLRTHYNKSHKNNPEEVEVVKRWINTGGLAKLEPKSNKPRKIKRALAGIPEHILLNPSSPQPSTPEEVVSLKKEGRLLNGAHFIVDIPPCEVENCGKEFPSTYLLRKHLEEHEATVENADKTFTCQHCNKGFKFEQSRTLHVASSHEKIPPLGADGLLYKCDMIKPCRLSPGFRTVDELNEHLKSHLDKEGSRGQILYCSTCHWGFLRQVALYQHELLHVQKNLTTGHYPCPLCDEAQPRSKNSLRFHYMSKHLSATCNFCGDHCGSKIGLKEHLFRVHGVEKKEKFPPKKKKKRVRVRPKRPQGEKKEYTFPCDICGDVFPRKSTLDYHQQKMHNKTLDFVCEQCGKNFSHKAHLQCHMECHEEPKFSCDICGRLFRRVQKLKVHKEIQHNPKREVTEICNVCGKGFLSEQGRIWHMLAIHTPESEWELKCSRCPKRFYRRSLRDMHLKNCAGGEQMTEENLESLYKI